MKTKRVRKVNKWKSRKLIITLTQLSLAWLAFMLPPIISAIYGFSFVILTEGAFVSLISLLTAAYLASNTMITKAEGTKNGLKIGASPNNGLEGEYEYADVEDDEEVTLIKKKKKSKEEDSKEIEE